MTCYNIMSHYSNEKAGRFTFDHISGSHRLNESPSFNAKRGAPKQLKPQVFQKGVYKNLSPSSRGLESFKVPAVQSNSPSYDFFSVLISQMRRIDENFNLEWTEETPLNQALNCIIQAINIIEREKSSLQPSYNPNQSEDYYESHENLSKIEEILKSKEEKLNFDLSALAREKQILSNEKDKIKRLKDRCINLEAEFKEKKSELEAKEQEDNQKILLIKEKLQKELDGLEEKKRIFERDTHEIEIIKSKLEEFSNTLFAERDELEFERSKIFEKTLEIDREKWRLESEKAVLDEKLVINNHLKEKIDEELVYLENERADLLKSKIELQAERLKNSEVLGEIESKKISLAELQNAVYTEKASLDEDRDRLIQEEERISQILAELEDEKRKIFDDRKIVDKDIEAVREEREAVDEAWDEIEKSQESQTGRVCRKGDDEYSNMLEELQNQMINYNKEVEKREKDFEVKNMALIEREVELERKSEEIQAMEFSLLRAKRDLEELSLGTIPELEAQSQHIQSILAEVLAKRSEVDTGYTQLQEKICEFERSKSNRSESPQISRLADELESKLYKIKEREEEIVHIEAELEREKKENLSHALFLQRAQKEFDIECSKKQAEIQAATKKLERLQSKLESAIFLMNSKESQLMNLKDLIMDERNKMTSPESFSRKDTPKEE